jgi:low affinity Fe/Cu permease
VAALTTGERPLLVTDSSSEHSGSDRRLRDRRPRLPLSTPHASSWKDRRWTSRLLHRLDETGSHPVAGFTAITLVIAWAGVGIMTGFPSWWATTLFSVTGSATFVMVFVIQHAQARQTSATQLKLDELIRASTRADDGLIAVEEAPQLLLDRLTETTVVDREWT